MKSILSVLWYCESITFYLSDSLLINIQVVLCFVLLLLKQTCCCDHPCVFLLTQVWGRFSLHLPSNVIFRRLFASFLNITNPIIFSWKIHNLSFEDHVRSGPSLSLIQNGGAPELVNWEYFEENLGVHRNLQLLYIYTVSLIWVPEKFLMLVYWGGRDRQRREDEELC